MYNHVRGNTISGGTVWRGQMSYVLQLQCHNVRQMETGDLVFGWTGLLIKTIKKVAHTRLPSVGFRSWSWFLSVSLQVTWVINLAVGCHYFLPGLQLPPQPSRGLLPILLLGEQRRNGCEQFAQDCCYSTASRLRFEPGPSAPESSTLTTRLPSHPIKQYDSLIPCRDLFTLECDGVYMCGRRRTNRRNSELKMVYCRPNNPSFDTFVALWRTGENARQINELKEKSKIKRHKEIWEVIRQTYMLDFLEIKDEFCSCLQTGEKWFHNNLWIIDKTKKKAPNLEESSR